MPRHLISDAHEWINEIPTVPIYSPQGLQTGLFLLQYGFSTPEVPELSSHRRPVVMFRRSGGLALTG